MLTVQITKPSGDTSNRECDGVVEARKHRIKAEKAGFTVKVSGGWSKKRID